MRPVVEHTLPYLAGWMPDRHFPRCPDATRHSMSTHQAGPPLTTAKTRERFFLRPGGGADGEAGRPRRRSSQGPQVVIIWRKRHGV